MTVGEQDPWCRIEGVAWADERYKERREGQRNWRVAAIDHLPRALINCTMLILVVKGGAVGECAGVC